MPKGRGKGRKGKGPAWRVTPARSVRSEDQPGTSTAGLIPASDDPDTLEMSEPSQTSRPSTVCTETSEMASDIPTEAIDIHNVMVHYLGTRIVETKLHKLKNLLKNNPLTPVDIASIKNIYDLFDSLMSYTTIAYGDYTQFVRKLKLTNPDLARYVIKKEKEIKSIVDGAKQPRPGDQGQQQSTDPATRIATTADTSQAKKIHPDLEPMIEKAKARIKREKEKKFYPTKGFCDAKEKLQKNRVVVIRGNTGDGKTTIAVQLLHWLSQEHEAGQPLQIQKIKKLELLAPNLKLVTFIDDIFGEKDVCKKDVQEWNRRISDVETLFVDEQAQPNFLIITIRNEVFNSLEKRSLRTILTEDNIIDLSSHTYKLAEEKKELLELYKPKNFSWTDKEKTQISTYAPNIGFPQCCQLFYNSEELQKERVNFFENPFHFLNEALLRLQECSALLYLFLNGGMIRVQDLDPNRENVNKILLEQAFSIKLIGGKNHTATPFCDKERKMGFIKDSFEELLGFLVKKEKHWSGEDVYRFNHDSIYVAVALLYGKVTPIGYIQNCPSQSLSYLTTSKTATNMIVISSDHYTEVCERLLREFECKENRHGTSIGSLDVWNDPEFVKRFVRFLNDRKVAKLAVLNKACDSGAKECALYLLCEGVEPNRDTALSLVTSRHWNDSNRQVCLLRKIVVYLNDETKVDVLNEACDSCAEECALYLLSEGVKPDKDTALWSLISIHRNDSNRQVSLLRKVVVYLNDETKVDVLNKACSDGAEECVLYLLSERVKPNKYTKLWSLVSIHWNDSNRQVCLLRKIVEYLNDETRVGVLNGACYSVAEECVLYLLSEGVKPDMDTALSLVSGYWKDSNVQERLLEKIVVYLNDETKLAMFNKACSSGAEECALYLLCEGVEPDKETVFRVVERGSVKVLRKLLEYDVTPTARDRNNDNVLHKAYWRGREDMVTLLQDKYPHLVHDTDRLGRTPLQVVARRGNCSMFQTVERCVLNSLYRVDDQQHKCESVNGRVVHRNCVCAQYMAQLVDVRGETVLHYSCAGDGKSEIYLYLCQSYPALTTVVDNAGRTVLHHSCWGGNGEVCLYLCWLCPALTTAIDKDGRHCLHYLARDSSDVERFTECESHVKQYLESTGRKYDITTILDHKGESVLDIAKERAPFLARYRPRRTENNPLLDHLIKEFGK